MRESAGGVIVNPEGKILLVEQHGNSWSFPKGGVEAGESRLEAAVREIGEETGITALELKGELGSFERRSIARDGAGETMEWPSTTRTFFLFSTPTVDVPVVNDPHGEITASRWVSVDEALRLLTHPKDREFLTAVRSRIEG